MLLQAQTHLINFRNAQQFTISLSTVVDRNLKWQTPPHNYLKANCDAGLDSQSKTTGIGGIVRDKNGNVLASFYFKLDGIHKPIIVEAVALRRTMTTYVDLGFHSHIYFEGDCKSLINWVNSNLEPPPELRAIIFNIKLLLQLYQN